VEENFIYGNGFIIAIMNDYELKRLNNVVIYR